MFEDFTFLKIFLQLVILYLSLWVNACWTLVELVNGYICRSQNCSWLDCWYKWASVQFTLLCCNFFFFFSAVSVCICEAHNLCPLYVQFLTLSKEVLHFAVLFLRRGQWCWFVVSFLNWSTSLYRIRGKNIQGAGQKQQLHNPWAVNDLATCQLVLLTGV